MHLVVAGFGMGMSLIVAIGAQNAFVLRMAIARRHVLPVIAVCAISDAILITAGIAGISTLLDHAPGAVDVIRWAGAAFLIVYGLLAARRALRPAALAAAPGGAVTIGAALATCLALTWLNPHTYLDTVLMLGSVANHYGNPGRWWFGVGAIVASAVWFGALGYGARHLQRWFAKPNSWRFLDGGVAVLMLGLGAGLVTAGT
ncbi:MULTISPECIES: LysE/ArgO family amino acid transporter [unclassified Rhodococcus (in: high G+C Gram-positive bacteria)]|uniref:LysE/ArgO family amino acid transporter n=1 Tax=unclassified Rhodococcus (in: high G+C Gram-positive bacteria) TaxID=192944 RepID=UPI00146D7AA4|nr:MULTISPECIES: LysE/ArgO family amino acid transporter [unclassified Rhodococcus (in: high G+C Gram-positive bacteria)]MBF0661469.1 amino acid transporter [Rhodococcus sp. (in: high G+C Gram-positive bacteria)]NMD97246.1 amino acid transporter [Rhodococcus sp. BL-253-APC-6A1W]NME80829.1 amino acid transporter [Rhodococcus sp. 105337]